MTETKPLKEDEMLSHGIKFHATPKNILKMLNEADFELYWG
jgi:hypothetical protein